jgi:hypothetical protein
MNAREAGAIKAPVRYGLINPTGSVAEPASVEDWLATLDPTALAAALAPLNTSIAANTAAIAANTAALNAVLAAWTSYTPTIAPASGSSTISGIAAAYKQIGKTVRFRITFTMSAVGTGTTRLDISLPVPGVTVNSVCSAISGTPAPVTGLLISGAPNDKIGLYSATGGFPATGTYFLAGSYEAL